MEIDIGCTEVNNHFPGVGASGWILKNGDVMRWQYTCTGLGSDIGNDNTAFGGSAGVTVADKDALIWKIAEINDAGTSATYGDDYTNAMTVLKNITASQNAVDSALAALNKQDGGNASAGGTSSSSSGGGTTSGTTNDSNTVTADDGSKFSDVSAGDWFNGAVGWAAGLGVINGYGGAYAPLDAVTRQDLVTILYRYAKQAGYNVSAGSVDLSAYADGAAVASYAAEAMRWAIAVGLIKGYEDNTLRPTATATRAEVAAIMQRLVQSAVK